MATPQYIQDDTGTYIPATQRPDGTWRKARRVREGYIPQEEMPLYESKGKQWAKNMPTLPVGMDPSYAEKKDAGSVSKTIPGLNGSNTTTKSSKKKKKKKNAASNEKDINESFKKVQISSTDLQTYTSESPPEENSLKKAQPVATDPIKRLRNLKKKLKDINALKLKIESGELANPEKDQLEKVSRKEEIEAEIEELEFEIEN